MPQTNSPVSLVLLLSIIYRYRHEGFALREFIPQFQDVQRKCENAVIRARISRRIREWNNELVYIENTLAARIYEFNELIAQYGHHYTQADYDYLQTEIIRGNNHMSVFMARKQSSIAYYKSIAGVQ